MTILNFVTQDELDELDDDPRVAFMALVNIGQRRLDEQTSCLDPQDEAQWETREDIRHSFMNVVIAAARRFEIEPFVSMNVPRRAKFNKDEYRQFKADLDHYITQLMLDNSSRSKRNSVAIPQKSKDDIRSYLTALRQCVEKADMPENKRQSLLDRLESFETELGRKRINILIVSLLVFEILGIPGSLGSSQDVVGKLVTNIMRTVAEAKSAEEEIRQLPPVVPFKALSPPRAKETEEVRRVSAPNYDLDEDIPF